MENVMGSEKEEKKVNKKTSTNKNAKTKTKGKGKGKGKGKAKNKAKANTPAKKVENKVENKVEEKKVENKIETDIGKFKVVNKEEKKKEKELKNIYEKALERKVEEVKEEVKEEVVVEEKAKEVKKSKKEIYKAIRKAVSKRIDILVKIAIILVTVFAIVSFSVKSIQYTIANRVPKLYIVTEDGKHAASVMKQSSSLDAFEYIDPVEYVKENDFRKLRVEPGEVIELVTEKINNVVPSSKEEDIYVKVFAGYNGNTLQNANLKEFKIKSGAYRIKIIAPDAPGEYTYQIVLRYDKRKSADYIFRVKVGV